MEFKCCLCVTVTGWWLWDLWWFSVELHKKSDWPWQPLTFEVLLWEFETTFLKSASRSGELHRSDSLLEIFIPIRSLEVSSRGSIIVKRTKPGQCETQSKTLLSEKDKTWLCAKSPPSHHVMFRFFRYFPKLWDETIRAFGSWSCEFGTQ